MVKIKVLPLLAIFLFTVICASSAADKKVVAAADAPAKVKHTAAKDMTAREMAAEIAETLDDEAEILNFIPGLKKETDPSGKTCYTFQGVNIVDLDKEKVGKLYNRVHQEKTRINTENINRQLESVRRIQQMNDIAQNSAAIRNIQSAPRLPPSVPSAVSVPQAPKAPPQQPMQPKRLDIQSGDIGKYNAKFSYRRSSVGRRG